MVTEGTRLYRGQCIICRKRKIFPLCIKYVWIWEITFLIHIPANVLKNIDPLNINVLFYQGFPYMCMCVCIGISVLKKGKNVTEECDRAFFNSKLHQDYFWNQREQRYSFVIRFISCHLKYHQSIFIYIVRRIMRIWIGLNVLGHSLPTKLYTDL